MGKVVAVIVGLVVITVIVAIVALILNRRATRFETLEKGLPLKGDLNAKQEQDLIAANKLAAAIMHQLLWQPLDLTSQASFLSATDRTAVEGWLQEHYIFAPANIQKGIKP